MTRQMMQWNHREIADGEVLLQHLSTPYPTAQLHLSRELRFTNCMVENGISLFYVHFVGFFSVLGTDLKDFSTANP
jgi:hypothetical protein